MEKIIVFILCLIFTFPDSSAINIKCNYNKKLDYAILGYIYQCEVTNNPNIIDSVSAQISTVSGIHEGSKTNDDVLSVSAGGKIIKIFPQGLHKFFKNLKGIYIYSSNLQEIHQSDLKYFGNLVYFFLGNNVIEVIEEGLFKFNPKLEAVGFYESKIIHIDPNVFDHLNLLSRLFFTSVPCINQDVLFSVEKVRNAINLSKNKCLSLEFLEITEKIEKLEDESKSLNFEESFVNFEKSFGNSIFLKFRPLKERFEDLQRTARCSYCVQMSKITTLETKLDNLTEHLNGLLTNDLRNITSKFDDLNSTQCGTKDSFKSIESSNVNLKNSINDLKTSQNEIQATLSGIKSSSVSHDSDLKNIQLTQNQLGNSLTSSIHKLSDDIVTLINKINNVDEKAVKLEDNVRELNDHFVDFEVKNTENFDKINKELVNSRHKIEVKFDEKIKVMEWRLLKKIGDILEEKLGKFFDSKLDSN